MGNSIICFEGASGIGKTTLCKLFSNSFNVVPEANSLFEKSGNDSKYWYYDKQIERFNLIKRSNRKSILDGDPFQPIWYNWVYKYPTNYLSQIEINNFYKEKLLKGEIEFPDKYIIFQVDEAILRDRKVKDKTRLRRHFEKHLELIEPQKRYFEFINQNTGIEVDFINFTELNDTKKEVESTIRDSKKIIKDDVKIFEQISSWIKEN